MRIEHDPDMAALKRDWLGARVVGAMGVLLIVAIAALAIAAMASRTARPPTAPAATTSPLAQAAARAREDIALCNAALASVQALGVLPAFAVRDGDHTQPGGAQGRYACGAKTDAANYRVTFDLACTSLDQPRCIVPFEVTQDGTSLYRRK